MLEHYHPKQKNSSTYLRRDTPTLKIKNITFTREYTKAIDPELVNFHLRMGRNTNHKYFQLKVKNKENNAEPATIPNNERKVGITDIFSIKSVNYKNSSKLVYPTRLFADISNFNINEIGDLSSNSSAYFHKRRSLTKELKKSQKTKTISDEKPKRQSSCELLSRKSRTQTEKYPQRLINRQKKLLLSTNDKVFETKFQNYCAFLNSVAQLHQIKINIQDYQKPPTVVIGKGNNSKLVKQTLKRRWWLRLQQKKVNQGINLNQVNFIWTQTKINEYYENHSNNLGRNFHNHFQFNGNLGNKKQLFLNMKAYYVGFGKNPFEHLPLTFHVKSIEDKQFKELKGYFQVDRAKSISKGLWIVKPGQNSNRGRGITIHAQLEEIQRVVNQQKNLGLKLEPHTFIIQKYIQKPFLYQKRKFDIRCYYLLVSINGKIKGYWYREGYIRTSCFEFNLNLMDQANSYIHLTNDAVQKHHEDYGKYEEGNKIDYNTFKKYLASKNLTKKYDFDTQIYQKMKQIALDSIKSTYKKLKKSNKQMFQIFGLDFMIDEQFKPWLIEVNTNPCLQTSCLVLERIIPKMVDDAFQLSVDIVFPPAKNWPSSRKNLVPNHLLTGFELIFDESKQQRND